MRSLFRSRSDPLPIIVTIIAGIIVPMSVPLVGSLMFGNLIRESGVLERLSQTAQHELANLITLLLGITIGSTMLADKFINLVTFFILFLGLCAFVFDTAGGVLFAKFLNIFLKKKINPMIGAAGISAFPMSARVIRKCQEGRSMNLGPDGDRANVVGSGSIVAGGIVIALIDMLTKAVMRNHMFLHALQSSGDLSIESLQAMDLWAQGLFVVAVGLIGVFLVLTLFFFTIVLMQKISESAGKRAKPAAEADGSES